MNLLEPIETKVVILKKKGLSGCDFLNYIYWNGFGMKSLLLKFDFVVRVNFCGPWNINVWMYVYVDMYALSLIFLPSYSFLFPVTWF